MSDTDTCQCPDLKTSLVTAMYGRPQPNCSDHPRTDEGERQVEVIPLNGRRELRDRMLANLVNPKDA